jgi:hypothetical protein
VRYIELFDPSLHTDCALTGSSSAGATTWTGFDHLEGRTVRVKGDGVLLANRVVTGGAITTERTVYALEAGLDYVTTVKTLTPEIQGQAGSAQAANLSVNAVTVRLRDTIGCSINYQRVPFKKLGLDALDRTPAPFTGDKEAGNLGWSKGVAQTVIQQTDPYPFHLLSVVTSLTINSG